MKRMATVHITDPDYFVRTRRVRPWCSHGRYVPIVDEPEYADCRLCLRRWSRWEREQEAS